MIASLGTSDKSTSSVSGMRHGQASAYLTFLEQRKLLDVLSAQRVRNALAAGSETIVTILLELGLLPEAVVADSQAEFLGLPRWHASETPQLMPDDFDIEGQYFKRLRIAPVAMSDHTIAVATANALDDEGPRALAYFLGRDLTVKVATVSELNVLIDQFANSSEPNGTLTKYGDEQSPQDEDVERLRDVAREAPTIKLLNRLVSSALERNASDIHIEPMEDHVRIRFRIDGALLETETLPKSVQAGLTSRVKILAKLNIAEQRLPQDGRIKIPIKGRDIDFRVSSTPVLFGESMAFRILDKSELPLDYGSLGFSSKAADQLTRIAQSPNGIVLVTGPTGSGKTTTLYATLKLLNKADAKLFTVEDPIEYYMKGVNQIQVKPQIGLDFASILRSVLRQDPDIIMIGEIRDLETAQIAIQASLTGHLVLSTLHTNSAASSISRLVDMGVEDYLLASSLKAIVAQRLLRKLCTACRHETPIPANFAKRFSVDPKGKIFTERGCAKCHGTGYLGRTVIYEILDVNEEVRSAILRKRPDTEIETLAAHRGMKTLTQSAVQKVIDGDTSFEEVIRTLGEGIV
jgi:general secretion pathway protein E